MPENALAFAIAMYGMSLTFWAVVFLHERAFRRNPVVAIAALAVGSLVFYLAAS
jgi:hypothetical protein